MSDVPPAPPPDFSPPGTQRAAGLAGTGRRYLLAVAALSSLAALPTLVAVTLGTASLNLGAPGRSPFGVPDGPPAVAVPDPDRVPPQPHRSPPERHRTPAEPGVPPHPTRAEPGVARSRAAPPGHSGVLVAAGGQSRITALRLDRPERECHQPWGLRHRPPGLRHRPPGAREHRPPGAREHRPGKTAARKGSAQVVKPQVVGRSIAGWSRPAGPRR